jgi:hypothetical protein
MTVFVTGTIPKGLRPGVKEFIGKYDTHEDQWSQIFDVEKSDLGTEEDVMVNMLGLAPTKTEGNGTAYDVMSQAYVKQYVNVAYGLGFIITKEAKDDNKFFKALERGIQGLIFAFDQTKENVHANVLNRGFNSSFTGGDTKELFATDHPTLSGDQQNELTVAADLSEASIEDLTILINKAQDNRGNQISIMPECLVVPPDLMYEATRIVYSTLQSGTANNDINAMNFKGIFPKGVKVNNYLTDADAWFIKTNAPRGLTTMERIARQFSKDLDFDTDNEKFKMYERYVPGWTDWRGAYGSAGA